MNQGASNAIGAARSLIVRQLAPYYFTHAELVHQDPSRSINSTQSSLQERVEVYANRHPQQSVPFSPIDCWNCNIARQRLD